MAKTFIPDVFKHLQVQGCITASDILSTQDGFCCIYKSLSEILAWKGIFDVPGSNGIRLACNRFFDDWFLYAVPSKDSCTYSLLKLREQEHDAKEDGPADGDTPGVTVSFIAFDTDALLRCLADPVDANRSALDSEINRVVARKGQSHDEALKRYFMEPKSEGAYLIASTYIRHIAAFAKEGTLEVPAHYQEIANQSAANPHSKKLARLPRFIESLNQAAGHTVCDNRKIYIQNSQAPTAFEAATILATHTGNTSLYSFAAEVEYHAKFLTPIAKVKLPILGRSVYDSAIRADMSVGDAEFQGPAPFYEEQSQIVKRQYSLHQQNPIAQEHKV